MTAAYRAVRTCFFGWFAMNTPTMPRLDLRCAGDVELEKKLLNDPTIRQAREALDKKGDLGARRQLLGTALRLTEPMAPKLTKMLADCSRVLGIDTPVELYVYPEASFNAACVRPEQGRVFILVSAALLEGFDEFELRFVLGHELGHHLFEHHRMPMGFLLQGDTPLPTSTALTLFAWSRYAEISADRAGLTCAGSLAPVTSSLFKLASGLKTPLFQVKIDDLLSQMGDMRREADLAASAVGRPQSEWFSTHPFSPLRLQAAQLFSNSEAFTKQSKDTLALEMAVADLMSLMEPTYLSDKSEMAETMRRVLLAGGILVASASGGIAEEEAALLTRFFGPGHLDNVSLESLKADLPTRLTAFRAAVPMLRRQQVLRDLCVVAKADRNVSEAERTLLFDLAKQSEVPLEFIEQCLAASARLD